MFEDKHRSFLRFFWILPLIAVPSLILVGYFEAHQAHLMTFEEVRDSRGGEYDTSTGNKLNNKTYERIRLKDDQEKEAFIDKKSAEFSSEHAKTNHLKVESGITENSDQTTLNELKEKTRKLKGKLKKKQILLDKLKEEESRHQANVDMDICKSKKLASQGSRPIVALASLPGSGNTWVRHLLESASGIFTGSIYSDKRLFRAGFFGEYENPWDGTLLVVKCHRFKTENSQQYDTGIVLVRNPFKAMISEYNRILTGKNHTAVADQSQFAGPEWESFVRQMGDKWYGVIEKWLQKDPNIHITYYEDIVTDTRKEIEKMLKFLKVEIDIARMNCTIANQEGSFHRTAKKEFDPFTSVMKSYVHHKIELANSLLLANGKQPIPKEYMSNVFR
ncbi:putative WSC domain-containing protein 2-like [Apostichopus japonicus]|uniref:Putative WSC domain-containing protein 2-like n=1 Tax=Stichopus japonicus TaxID=307972 RepID=A0A2G8KQG4_STIJA|nr:putative WSC domain-containing protein 2-like [Apostichopus japonicus]